MTPRTPAEAFADAARALLHEHDVNDLLLRLTRDAARFAGADAAGLVVRTGHVLELLSATSHAAAQIELYQAMGTEGPCLDTIETGEVVVVTGAGELADRWPTAGPLIVDAGFQAVHACPLTWQDGVLGGLNLFRRAALAPGEDEVRTAQAFADMLTLAVVRPERLAHRDVDRRVERALEGRVAIEQAKGVLAHQLGVDMASAYEELIGRSAREGGTLTDTAHAVIRQALRP
jgi:transcriptional regulator with GAF, ATPase, and Fis domain